MTIEEYKVELERFGVVKHGHFKLRSGQHSNIYIQKDAIYCNPDLFRRTIDFMTEESVRGVSHYFGDPHSMALHQCDVITGPAVAGAVLAAPIAVRKGKIFVYPEKIPEIKRHDYIQQHTNKHILETKIVHTMQLRRGYDKIVRNKKVLLIEDIITTGGSVIDTIRTIINAEGRVIEVRCVWNRTGFSLPGGNYYNNIEIKAPVHSIINDPVESWEPDKCPLCEKIECPECHGKWVADHDIDPDDTGCGRCGNDMVVKPLTDPKTGKEIKCN